MWFYDYKADIYTYESIVNPDWGFNEDKYVKKSTINCDIQPIGVEKIKASYGYILEANYRMYADELLNESDIVLWNNKTFKIEKIISWNDYNIYLLKDVVVDLGL